MTEFDHLADITAYHDSTGLVRGIGVDALDLPPRWRAIAEAAGARERIDAALSLWSDHLLPSLPTFGARFTDRLFDVQVCTVEGDGAPALLYATRHDDGHPIHWIGLDPRAWVDPVFPETLPAAVHTFLREVHGGFTAVDGESGGILRPRWQGTLAAWLGVEEGIPEYDERVPIPSTRLMVVAVNGADVHYCTTPDCPPDTMVIVDGESDEFGVSKFYSALDDLMANRFTYLR